MGTVAGTTSAYAENTGSRPSASANLRNYLRVRGEYITRVAWSCTASELPPRTRRILCACENSCENMGTTSAYAENTTSATWIRSNGWNYLRVRGEYNGWKRKFCCMRELPPRTRRIHNVLRHYAGQHGTTSAYAENTRCRRTDANPSWNYLRVRGEYPK